MKRVGAIGKKTVVLAGALALSSCVVSSAFALSSSDSEALQDSAEIVAATEVGTGVVSGEGSSENESADIPSYGWYLNEATGDWSFYKDSMLVKGWLSTGGFWYWFDDQGIMATGLTSCNGVFYFLNPGDCSGPVGAMKTGWVFDSANNVWRHFDASGAMQTGWLLTGGAWYWLDRANGSMAQGVSNCDGACYHFDASGAMTTGWSLDGDAWFLSKASGELLSGWQHVGGAWYWLDGTTFEMWMGWLDADGQKYYLDASGAMVTGVFSDGSVWYFADGSGVVDTVSRGWEKYSQGWRYFNEDSSIVVGWTTIDGKPYYFGDQAIMATGWEKIDASWYFFDASGVNARDVWAYLGGAWYHFDEDGVMQTAWFKDGNTWYYANGSGAMQTGWLAWGDTWYYFDAGGSMAVSGWRNVGGTWYYFDADGIMQTGWFKDGKTWYYANGSGAMLTGWQFLGGAWFYLGANGAMVSSDWSYINGAWYYFDENGYMLTGWLDLGTEENHQWYYLKASGAMQTGWAHISDSWGSRYYYFGADGLMTKSQAQPDRLRPDLVSEGWYISPLLADSNNTREERIEAMISTAYEYLGNTYKPCYSQAPGGYVDCSGLAMQGLYAAGFDPAPVSPKRHSDPAYEYESRNMWNLNIPRVSYADRQRGDLIYYDNGYGKIIHIAIYLGNDQVIEAWPPQVTVWPVVNWAHPHVYGVQRPF